MDVKPISYSTPAVSTGIPRGPQPGPAGAGFAETLLDSMADLGRLQARADELGIRMVLNKDVELHDAVLATEEASLAFQYTLQVRNKILEAYQEVMRMQV